LAGDPVFNTIDHYRKGIKTMKAKIKLSPSLPVLTAQVVLPKSVVAAIDRRADANFRSRSEVIRSIMLPVPLVAQIDAMAGQLLRSRSATIRDVLAAYFADRGMIKVSGRDAIDETLRLAGLDNIREQSR
jgi:hypothetical protein